MERAGDDGEYAAVAEIQRQTTPVMRRRLLMADQKTVRF